MLQEEAIIIGLYCAISDVPGDKDFRYPQSDLYLSEIVLTGVRRAFPIG